MRQKRAKTYRKHLTYLHLNFHFRTPYQILVDDEIVLEAVRCKLDLGKALVRTVQQQGGAPERGGERERGAGRESYSGREQQYQQRGGRGGDRGAEKGGDKGGVKMMITQCCMEALYNSGNEEAIAIAKGMERRRCGHRPLPKGKAAEAAAAAKAEAEAAEAAKAEAEADENEDADSEKPKKKSKKKKEPELGTLKPHDCLYSVIVHNNQNKHRYLVATQKTKLRARLRKIPAVPLIYLSRSVMVMEPMSPATVKERERIEAAKLVGGLNTVSGKRKRGAEEGGEDGSDSEGDGEGKEGGQQEKKKVKVKGPKQPNPLSIKKKKTTSATTPKPKVSGGEGGENNEDGGEGEKKKRRRRTHHGGAKADGTDASDLAESKESSEPKELSEPSEPKEVKEVNETVDEAMED